MPIQYNDTCQKLECTRDELLRKKHELKTVINESLDELLDNELERFHRQCEDSERRSGLTIFSFIRGVYYLTLAKFTNPVAYRMAWRVMGKLEEPIPGDDGISVGSYA